MNNLTQFLEILKTLRWDELNNEETVKQFEEFFNRGYVPAFYIATLETILEAAKAAEENQAAQRRKVIKAITARKM